MGHRSFPMPCEICVIMPTPVIALSTPTASVVPASVPAAVVQALRSDASDQLMALIDSGVSPVGTIRDVGYLTLAVKFKARACAKALLDAGARNDLEACWAALVHAATYDNKTMCELLWHEGVDMNTVSPNSRRVVTALHKAALRGHADLCQWLLEHGAHVDRQTHTGATALLFAAGHNHEAVCRVLLALGADPNTRNKKGEAPLTRAAVTTSALHVCRVLLEAGADPTVRSIDGRTARNNTRDPLVRTLLEGAEQAWADRTALQHAVDQTGGDGMGRSASPRRGRTL